jgi:hypothetical protein
MSYETEAAVRYRNHAETLRRLAKTDRYEPTKQLLLRVAADYDLMARSLMDIEAAKHKSQQHVLLVA